MTALSIVIPSNRRSLSTYSRILAAGAWASDKIETIVRDNSGDDEKRRVLSALQRPNFRLVLSEPCDVFTNFLEAFREAKGDFVFFFGDDDSAFDRGIAAMAEAAASLATDESVAGITGTYVFDDFRTSKIAAYENVDSPDVRTRLGGFLSFDGPNLLFSSAIRRTLILKTWDLVHPHPFQFPFRDQLFSMLYLLAGRVISVGRFAYVYENSTWEVTSGEHPGDQKYYAAAGMDPAMRWLQWIVCGFEGASFIIHSSLSAPYSIEERHAMANAWFATMFRRFVQEPIKAPGSPLDPQATALCQHWRSLHPNFSLEPLLEDICGFVALFSQEKANAYRSYWTPILRSGSAESTYASSKR